ncbi:ABC transporter permease [Parasalinivibrio latis]|uniref:ABC transporter permease n=1 Tax=Parasalinivibrio latis TaxID=2952610 RepID=UPI0030E28BD0
MGEALNISNLSLAGFYLLFLIPLVLFHRWRLGLSKRLVSSVLRMTVQLSVVGLYLTTLFTFQNIWLNGLWLLVMVLVACSSICKQAGVSVRQFGPALLAGQISALILVLPVMLFGVIQAKPWWQAQYLIPVAGMLLGNCLSANVLALERWYSSLKKRNEEYQYYLSLGASRPTQPFVSEAVKAAVGPQLASMTALGIVSLPGMMTGQILGGTEPLLAVKYQLVIMTAIFISVTLSVTLALSVAGKVAFDCWGRLKP